MDDDENLREAKNEAVRYDPSPEFFHMARLRARQNIEKWEFGPSKIALGRSESWPGATQNAKKTTNMSKKRRTNAQKPAKSEKKAPKSEKCANMVPTCRGFDFDFESLGPHPKACKAVCLPKH